MRPADGSAGLRVPTRLVSSRPTFLPSLSRQVVPNLAGTSREGVRKGAYVAGPPPAGLRHHLALAPALAAVDAAKELGAKARAVPAHTRSLRTGRRYKTSITLRCAHRLHRGWLHPDWSKYADIPRPRPSVLPRPLVSSTRSSESPLRPRSRRRSRSCKLICHTHLRDQFIFYRG